MSSLSTVVPVHDDDEGGEPSAAELTAIDNEWPEIEADLAVVDAMARMARSERPSELDWKALRRAEHRALAVRAGLRRSIRSAEFGPEAA